MSAIELVRNKYKLTDQSIVRNVQELCQLEMTDGQYLAAIAELRGDRHKIEPLPDREHHQSKYVFRYLVYNLLKTPDAPIEDLYTKSIADAVKYIDENPWVFAKPDDETPPKLNPDGTVAPKKGDKKVIAKKVYEENKGKVNTRKEWIALLVKEVGLTEAGASTYYANLKSGKY